MILLMYYWIWFANVEDFCSFVHQGCVCSVAECVQLFVTPWTVVRQAPLSIEFSRQEYWSGLPFLTPEGLPDPGIKPTSLRFSALAGRLFTTSAILGSPMPKAEALQLLSEILFVFHSTPSFFLLVLTFWQPSSLILNSYISLPFSFARILVACLKRP